MRPGRELNMKIATEVFGHNVFKHKGILHESHPAGDRPLRNYSNEIEWAFEVAAKLKITLIPVIDDQWFAFIGSLDEKGWDSPQAMLKFLEAGNFAQSGAAVDKNPCLAICMAALKAVEKRKPTLAADAVLEAAPSETAPGEPVTPVTEAANLH